MLLARLMHGESFAHIAVSTLLPRSVLVQSYLLSPSCTVWPFPYQYKHRQSEG
jgi:hypothetical protein